MQAQNPTTKQSASIRIGRIAAVCLFGLAFLSPAVQSEQPATPADALLELPNIDRIPPAPTSEFPPASDSQPKATEEEKGEKADTKPVLVPPAPEPQLPRKSDTEDLPVPVAPANLPSAKSSDSKVPPKPASAEQSRVEQVQAGTEEWKISIIPLPEKKRAPSLTDHYQEVYQSIPFRRAEYLANPSYRHDTTVEVLFGQMRPTVIHRNNTPERAVNPRPPLTQPYPISKGELYSYWPLLQYGSPIPLLSPIR